MKYKVLTMNEFYKNWEFPNRQIFGLYPSSDFSPIPDYGNKVFMIIFNLDYDHYLIDSAPLPVSDYAQSCVQSLNKVPKSKRDSSPIFGNLTFYRSKLLEKQGKKYIQVHALTNEQKNKFMFRFGEQVASSIPPVPVKKPSEVDDGGRYIAKLEKILTSVVDNVLPATPKKRGRPPKANKPVAKVENKTPKKRGRPPKNKKK